MSAVYLVTGGAGFIGSHIVDALVERGETVRVLDNFATGQWQNTLGFGDRVQLVEGDIRDVETVREAVAGADVVLHHAALPSVSRSVEQPGTSHDVNATGTLNVLLAARDAEVRRVVYASSSSIYGNEGAVTKSEDMPARPLSPYAVAKFAGESYSHVFAKVYGLPTISLRYFNVFGPRQNPASHYAGVIVRFIAAMARHERPTIFGDGLQSRDFTYVDNVVDAALLAAEAPSEVSGAFNVGGEDRHTLLELAAALNDILGAELEPERGPARAGEVRHSQASCAAIRKALGFRPSVDFMEGLERTVSWYRSLEPARDAARLRHR
jgi:nucleoside-diphosphate-sugar epimerase